MAKLIRLGCLCCDRDDFDGIDAFPSDWEKIGEVQSFKESMKERGFSDQFGQSCFDWQTHLGIFPECREDHC